MGLALGRQRQLVFAGENPGEEKALRREKTRVWQDHKDVLSIDLQVQVRALQDWGRSHLKGLAVTMPPTHTGDRSCFCQPNWKSSWFMEHWVENAEGLVSNAQLRSRTNLKGIYKNTIISSTK